MKGKGNKAKSTGSKFRNCKSSVTRGGKKKSHLIHPLVEDAFHFLNIYLTNHSNQFAHIDLDLTFPLQNQVIRNVILNKT